MVGGCTVVRSMLLLLFVSATGMVAYAESLIACPDCEKPYAVMPLEKLVGLKTMTFSFVSTNAPINYVSIEVANALPLVRFGISETNLLFKTEADVAPNQEWQKISPMRLKRDAEKMLKERTAK